MAPSKSLLYPAVLFLCFFFTREHAVACQGARAGQCLADTIPGSCPMNDEIEKIITEAISLGAPIYNEGLHMACYRIYEWAGYKILYEYGKKCGEIEKTLKTAIDKSHGDYSDTEKAWIMRMAFDKILGVSTKTTDPEAPKGPDLRKG
jgi:hypothetical protein